MSVKCKQNYMSVKPCSDSGLSVASDDACRACNQSVSNENLISAAVSSPGMHTDTCHHALA